MNPACRNSITLAAALLLGVALGLGLAGLPEKKPAPEVLPSSTAPSVPVVPAAGYDSSSDGLASSTTRTAEVSPPDAYAAAWELLQQRDLRRSERQKLESALLAEWGKVDLRAALHAQFAAMPNGDEDDPFQARFGPCSEEVGRQPDLVWKLISSREYGLHTRLLRAEWIDSCAGRQPLEVLRCLPDLPVEDRAEAIEMAIYYTHRRSQPAPGKDEVVTAVLALRGTPDEAAVLEGFAMGLARVTETSELGTLLLDPPTPELREVYLMAYAEAIDGGGALRENPHLDSLPPDLRAEVEAVMKARRAER